MLAAGHSVLLLLFRSSFFLFCRLISEFTWPIVTKIYDMLHGDPDLWNSIRSLAAKKKHEISV